MPRTTAELFPKAPEILHGQELYNRARAVAKEFNKRAAARGVKPAPALLPPPPGEEPEKK